MYKKTASFYLCRTFGKIDSFFYANFTEPPITQDQINLLKYDNIKSENSTTNFDIGCSNSKNLKKAL